MDFTSLISVSKKTGFTVLNSSNVKIFDNKGVPFYFRNNVKGVFNLPKGKYFTNNKLKLASKPKIYKTVNLPKKERFARVKNLSITLSENPNKCSIYIGTGEIVADSNFFKSLTKPQKYFILLHEIGHYMYATETYADLYSLKEMIKIGFNPSQVANAINDTLTQAKSNERKINVVSKYFKNE